ncbi:MAG TPA: thioredoxin [Candidatus Pacearchaeota archaeon]|nr:thioredoxin [Candidatus Pacearchaeota archaeon]
MAEIIEVNDKNFEKEVIEKSKQIPVVVDFYASWCLPCSILSPILKKVAKESKKEFVLAIANVDETKEFAEKFNVLSIPNVKLFKNGKVVNEFVGAMPETLVRKWLEENL